jgi:excisionase family DNA binding protein
MTTILQMNQEDLRAEIKNCLRESIEEIKKIQVEPPQSDRIGLQEAMQVTGLQKSALYKMTMTGTIPHEKYGKRLVFSRKKLAGWIEQRTIRKQSLEEIAIKQLQKEAQKRIR